MALGSFELDDLKYFFSTIRSDDSIFDIGANVGAYSIPLARSFPKANVFAFEPIPLNYSLILASSRINRVTNLSVFESCISDKSGTERSEEHTSELQSLMRISYAVFCLKKLNRYAHQLIHM